jgi:hypothetical protein
MSWACECSQGAITIPDNVTCLSPWGRTGAIRQRLARIARLCFAASGLDRTLPGTVRAHHKGKANQSVASAKLNGVRACSTSAMPAITIEFCMAEKFRDAPFVDIWSFERTIGSPAHRLETPRPSPFLECRLDAASADPRKGPIGGTLGTVGDVPAPGIGSDRID